MGGPPDPRSPRDHNATQMHQEAGRSNAGGVGWRQRHSGGLHTGQLWWEVVLVGHNDRQLTTLAVDNEFQN